MKHIHATLFDIVQSYIFNKASDLYGPLVNVELFNNEILSPDKRTASELLDIFDIAKKTVCFDGAGLNQLAREAVKLGARSVSTIDNLTEIGILGRLISSAENYPIVSATKPSQAKYMNISDVDFSFEFDTSCENSKYHPNRAKIFIGSREDFKEACIKNFDTTLIVDHVGDDNFVISQFKSRGEAWKTFNSLQSKERNLSIYHKVTASDISVPAFESIRRMIRNGEVLDFTFLPRESYAHEACARDVPTGVHDPFYWVEYYRGMLQFKDDGFLLRDDNSYLRIFRKILEKGNIFDPGAMNAMKDETVLRERISKRLLNLDKVERAAQVPIGFFSVEGQKQNMEIKTHSGKILHASALDGYHRLGAALLFSQEELMLCHMEVVGVL
ncbi:MAG: hypothetical protein ACXIUW_06025 [Roseinatronobacter sp.]